MRRLSCLGPRLLSLALVDLETVPSLDVLGAHGIVDLSEHVVWKMALVALLLSSRMSTETQRA